MSSHSKTGGSRASDEDGRTAVRVGKLFALLAGTQPRPRDMWTCGHVELIIFRVAVRVRPPLKPTDPGFDLIPQRFQRSMVQTTSNTSISIDSPQGKKIFVFDRVFSPDTDQEGVWEYLSDSINAFLQGYNVSLLAYGQSGAGKSHTMGTSGPLEQIEPEALGTYTLLFPDMSWYLATIWGFLRYHYPVVLSLSVFVLWYADWLVAA